VLLVTCTNGTNATMATVATTIPSATPGNTTISLIAAQAGNPYRDNNLTQSCLGPDSAVFLVDRFRYFIASYALPGAVAGTVPFLMLDTGLDLNQDNKVTEDNDTADLIPVAKGVEDLQVSYVINNGVPYGYAAPDSNLNWIIADVAGIQEEPNTSPPNTAPTYALSIDDPARYNMHPGNIHSVRFEMTVRSVNPDPAIAPPALGDAPGQFENRNDLTAVTTGQFRRVQFKSLVTARDMQSRSAFIF
jgi:hypothetical protein